MRDALRAASKKLAAAKDPALRPCPFCGGRAEYRVGEHDFHDAKVGCADCGAEGPLFDDSYEDATGDGRARLNKAEAAKHWNTRRRAK